MSISEIKATSNTARAYFAAANLFKHPHTVIWEYVTNEIQYREKGTKPEVHVAIEEDKIIIKGNGEGMDVVGLKNFFTLHGENQHRKEGKPGRGKHGTGKSAAFAIAEELLISTVKDKKLIEIKLSKKELKKFEKSGKDIPLNDFFITKGKKVNDSNGTTIEISKLNQKINRKEVIEYIEKQIAYFKGAEVWVDKHQCQYTEPFSKQTSIFNSLKTHPELGNIDLTIKVAGEPLEKNEFGIKILSNSTLQEITLCGSEGKEMSDYIFGEINCPKLDNDDQEIAATDMSRNMSLNQNNKLVKSLFSFIGMHVEDIRKKLVKENEERKQSEEAQKLEKEAKKISDKLNQHFEKFKNKIKIRQSRYADGKSGIAAASNSGANNADGSLSIGDEIEALLNNDLNILKSLKSNKENDRDNKNKNNPKNLEEKKEEQKKGKKVNGGGKNKSSGGTEFKVKYQNNLAENPRAKFKADENTVYINLDHPYISDLKKGDASKDITKNLFFTKISHEIAYTEYAMGLVNLLHSKQYYGEDTADYLREVRDIINTLSTPS
jgi:hypothetical protein